MRVEPLKGPELAPSAAIEPAPESQVTSTRARPSMLRDLVALTKPRITTLVVATMMAGIFLARRVGAREGLASTPTRVLLLGLVGTVLIVAGANALNMYWERDTDALMERTRERPLPRGRLSPELALAFGIALSALAVPMLTFGVNPTTGLLATLALASYVLVYTPLKRRTTAALLIGAVPGAIPPLLGWTTVTGSCGTGGLLLFAVLFIWQVPHFLAIATFRRDDYARAGLQVMPVVRGDRATRVHALGYSVLLVLVSTLFVPTGLASTAYLVAALVLGAPFIGIALRAVASKKDVSWARALFAYSIVYLVLLLTALMLSA